MRLRFRWIVLLVVIAGSVAMWFNDGKKSLRASANVKLPITNMHRAIAQEGEWLNVSRPLLNEDLRGRIILLDFWTFCCINCMHIIPDLQYLEHTFGNNLTVIGVHSAKFLNEKDKENIRSAVLRYGIEHPVVNDASFRIWNSFGVTAWPSLILINPLGKIESIYSGEGHRDDIARDVASLIEDYKGRLNTTPLPIELERTKAPESVLRYPGKLEIGKKIAAYKGKDALFISDSSNNRILAVEEKTGNVLGIYGGAKAGFSDGIADKALFSRPQGMAYHNNTLYVADTGNHAVRMINLASGSVVTIAGTGKQGFDRRVSNVDAREANLSSPWDITFYPDHDHLVIAMAGLHQLWIYDMVSKKIGVLAGNGSESIDDGSYPLNSLSQPNGLVALGDKLYFVDSETSSLRVFADDGVTTLIGSGLFDFGFKDGEKGVALLQHPIGIDADQEGIYIADSYNHSIRKYDLKTGKLSTLYGDGKRFDPRTEILRFNEPNDVLHQNGKFYVADTNANQIRIIDQKTGKAETLAIQLKPKNTLAAKEEGETPLPNLKSAPVPQVNAQQEVIVKLKMPEGWKLNPNAPSYLLLSEDGINIKQWDNRILKGLEILLPSLKKGKHYRLYGTFYFCEKKDNAICRLQSYDQRFTPSETELKNDGSIAIELQAKD
ncbi:MAG: hypothetical protein EB060_00055 [Proteobacteria bacterium]|nr:hypothetical protein [Pseudomonadota bacterium]